MGTEISGAEGLRKSESKSNRTSNNVEVGVGVGEGSLIADV